MAILIPFPGAWVIIVIAWLQADGGKIVGAAVQRSADWQILFGPPLVLALTSELSAYEKLGG